MRRAAHSQDTVGWKHLLAGKVSVCIRRLQEFFLVGCDTMITIDDWMRGFITKLLEISHSQWIYRNLTKHHASQGKIALKAREDLMREVERQLDLGLNNLPPESRCLLEIDPADLFCRTTEKVQYWLNATLAARAAGERALEVSNGKTASWLEIQRDETYVLVPATYVAPEAEDSDTTTKQTESTAPTGESTTESDRKSSCAAPAAKRAKPEPTPPAPAVLTPPLPARTPRQRVDTTDLPKRRAERRAQSKRGQGTRPTTLTRARDRLKLTAEYTSVVPKHDRDLVGKALQGTLPTRSDGTVIDRDFIRREGFQMQFGSFLTLRPSTWLNDEVINYAMARLINPLSDQIHCYSSHFFTRCLKRTADGPRFDYDEVKRWSARIPGGMDNLEDLYVPINKSNAHWLFLRVHFRTRTIDLYDSLGLKTSNSLYLETMLQYLYAEYKQRQQEAEATAASFEVWSRSWTTADRSEESPQQENGDDCGVFTIVSISLLAQGVRLRHSSYDQHLIDNKKVRKRLAHIAWKDRLNPSASPSQLQRRVTQGSTPRDTAKGKGPTSGKSATKTPSAKTPTLAKAKRAETRERLRRRRYRDRSKLVLGGIRVKRRITSHDSTLSHQDGTQRNRKRSAASIAAAAGAAPTSQRQLPPQKRRKRHAAPG